MPYVKNKIKVKVPHLSGYDMRHRNTGTGYCGELVPLLTEEVVPGPQHLALPINIQLPPLVSDTYMNLKYKVEAFFVPKRLIHKSFESFFSDFPQTVISNEATGSDGVQFTDLKGVEPVFSLGTTSGASVNLAAGSLLDYMGFKSGRPNYGIMHFNLSPLVGYHLIWQEWYRNPRVQRPAFVESLHNDAIPARSRVCNIPFTFFHGAVPSRNITDNHVFDFSTANTCLLADGHNIFETRQRNFGLDYFTGARVSPQQGSPSSVTMEVSQTAEGADIATMTIAQLRAGNSLQQFRERNNLPSPRTVDQVRARYNVDLSDGVAQRPICIGSASYDVGARGIDQTGASSDVAASNPFSTIGAQYGRAGVSGSDFIIDNFFAKEPGYIYVIGSLVPEPTYTNGINPMFRRYTQDGSITDMACSLLQNVGDQPIRRYELTGLGAADDLAIFGYTDRYADWMFHPNECHGQMREVSWSDSGEPGFVNGNLRSFVLQRAFLPGSEGPELSSAFLEIPKNYLDGVMQFDSATIGLSYWYDAMVMYKRSMPLAEFSIPSLQDPAYEHGQTVTLYRNGQIF